MSIWLATKQGIMCQQSALRLNCFRFADDVKLGKIFNRLND